VSIQPPRPIRPLPSDHPRTREFLTRCCEILIAAESDLNALDARIGDGDTGTTLATAARALIAAMDDLPLADHTQLCRAIGLELSQAMGGSSGVLLAIFFAAAGDAASSGVPIRQALQIGLTRDAAPLHRDYIPDEEQWLAARESGEAGAEIIRDLPRRRTGSI